jgi:anion-transporting  ArsA/GET3 family ATPase
LKKSIKPQTKNQVIFMKTQLYAVLGSLLWLHCVVSLQAQTILEVFTNNPDERFWLFVNGKQINLPAQTNVVAKFEQENMKIKLVFVNDSIPIVEDFCKTNLGKANNATQIIVKEKIVFEVWKNKKGVHQLKRISQRYEYQPLYQRVEIQAAQIFPMRMTDFLEVKEKVESQAYQDEKLNIALEMLQNHWLSASQVAWMLQSLHVHQLEFAQKAYYRTVDKENFQQVINQLTLMDDKTQLIAFVEKHQ